MMVGYVCLDNVLNLASGILLYMHSYNVQYDALWLTVTVTVCLRIIPQVC